MGCAAIHAQRLCRCRGRRAQERAPQDEGWAWAKALETCPRKHLMVRRRFFSASRTMGCAAIHAQRLCRCRGGRRAQERAPQDEGWAWAKALDMPTQTPHGEEALLQRRLEPWAARPSFETRARARSSG